MKRQIIQIAESIRILISELHLRHAIFRRRCELSSQPASQPASERVDKRQYAIEVGVMIGDVRRRPCGFDRETKTGN